MKEQEPIERPEPPALPPLARPITVESTAPPAEAHPLLLTAHPRRWAAADICAVFIAIIAIDLVFSTILQWVLTERSFADERPVKLVATLIRGAFVVVVIFLAVSARRQSLASIGLCSRCWWSTLLFGLVATGGAFAVIFGCSVFISTFVPSLRSSLDHNAERVFEEIPKLHPVALAAIAAFVGFYEEVLFRGFLITRLRRATGSAVVSVLAVSALFAVLHVQTQEPVMAVPLFLLSVLWAVLTLWRKSLVPAIIGHALFDLGMFLYMYYAAPQWT